MFELVSSYPPAGDQPQAIAKLTAGLEAGAKHQTLLGVTGPVVLRACFLHHPYRWDNFRTS